jgi:hypothetical protein
VGARGAGAPDAGANESAAPQPRGEDRRGASGGHGIAGLAERARQLNGTIEAGGLPGGGYRLTVTVPVSHA